ncbi:MAG: FAD:protein FMN transferase [Pirellula sp.]
MTKSRRQILEQLAGSLVGCTVLTQSLFYSGLSRGANLLLDEHEIEFPSMGSKINMRWFDHRQGSRQQVMAMAKRVSDKWTSVLSDYEEESEAMQACLQADSGGWVDVSGELMEAIRICDYWHLESDGALDAAIGAITRLRRRRRLASEQQWTQAKQSCGWELLEIDRFHPRFRSKRPGVRLDFGAVGKGMVADKIALELKEIGISQFVVNASGNMRLGDSPPNAEGWPISIDIPPLQVGDNTVEFCRMRLNQSGVATSGDRWQRFPDSLEQPGKAENVPRTSHIIDPKTLRGIAGHHSVSVFSNQATRADAIATITSVRLQNDLAGWLDRLRTIQPKDKVIILAREGNQTGVSLRYSGD